MSIDRKLEELGLTLPEPFQYPSPNRTGCVEVGNLLFASGHPPSQELGARISGKVDGDIGENDARFAAQSCALNILASVRRHLGSLDRIKRVVKVTGYVNSSPGFQRQFAVVDGASDLFLELWGPEFGCHARSAIGVAELPRGFPMEVEAVFEIAD